jgi:RNA polymerase sigma-70 factor (ECF subfamily)
MSVSDSEQDASHASHEWFCTTRWNLVLLAGQGGSPQAEEALEKLCRTYWYPLYAFVRRKGHNAEDAQDLTQAFFAHLLEKNYLARANPDKGRFRSFLLTGLNHFLVNEWARARAEKRGGGHVPISLDAATAETWYGREPATDTTPEKIYEKRWALALLEQAVARLGEEQKAEGKARQFELLKPFLSAEATLVDYDRVARELGTSRDAVKMAVSRLRKRYRALVHEEVAHTVANPGEVEEELRWLFKVLSR